MQSEWKVRRNSCGETLGDAALGRGKVLYPGLRHTSSEHVAKHTVKAALLWQLGGVKQVGLLSFSEEELCDRELFDEMHESICGVDDNSSSHRRPGFKICQRAS